MSWKDILKEDPQDGINAQTTLTGLLQYVKELPEQTWGDSPFSQDHIDELWRALMTVKSAIHANRTIPPNYLENFKNTATRTYGLRDKWVELAQTGSL